MNFFYITFGATFISCWIRICIRNAGQDPGDKSNADPEHCFFHPICVYLPLPSVIPWSSLFLYYVYPFSLFRFVSPIHLQYIPNTQSILTVFNYFFKCANIYFVNGSSSLLVVNSPAS
jgi:hypothetical protein